MNKLPLTLAIDTSCDETSVSIVYGTTILSNVLPSQTEFHAKYGGIVPSLAKLAHEERIDNVIQEALKKSKKDITEIEYIAVTIGPGLAIALEVGIRKAKELAEQHNIPLITVNHMEGHLLSAFAERNSKSETLNSKQNVKSKIENSKSSYEHREASNINYLLNKQTYPILGLLVSGKHTEIVLCKEIGDYKIIGETLDDACGEAFDKCGRLLGLGYPAGPTVAEFAKRNRKNFDFKQYNKNLSTLLTATNKITGKQYELPISMANSGDLNFSYSGLKTAFKQLVDKQNDLSKESIEDLCVIFEVAAFRPIELKLQKAIIQNNPKAIWLGGGVAANSYLRKLIRRICIQNGIEFHSPLDRKLTTDNAAMIGLAANVNMIRSEELGIINKNIIASSDFNKVDRIPSLSF